MYFGKEVEQAIVEYNQTDNRYHQERLFNSTIYPALSKLIENVFHNRKFYQYGLDAYPAVKHECICHLHARIGKFNPEKGKAFSYFNRVTIHWVFAFVNRLNKERAMFPEFVNEDEDGEERPSLSVVDYSRDLYREQAEDDYKESLSDFVQTWADWGNEHLDYLYFVKDTRIVPFTYTDKRIANAIFDLFKQVHSIDTFNKKQLYLLIREQVDGVKTQQITDVANAIKGMCKNMFLEFQSTGTKYWHRHLYYPEGIGETTDENLEAIVNENRYSIVHQEYW